MSDAQAQTAQVGIQGYVSPRCWSARAPSTFAQSGEPPSIAAARCNKASPQLETRIRALAADGSLAPRDAALPTASQLHGRSAYEIIVSPHL